MDATVIRARIPSALIVGARGRNVLKVVTAFESRRIVTLRAEDITSAREHLAVEMPQVVLALVPPKNNAERDAFTECAVAVGALVVYLDPQLDDATFEEILDRTVEAVLERTRGRERNETQALTMGVTDAPPPEELDDGWDG